MNNILYSSKYMLKSIEPIKERWKQLEKEGKIVKKKKMVDICIPAYKEEGYIEKTIDSLMNQTLWKEDLMNIVVGEYSENPKYLKGIKKSYLKELCEKNKVLHTYVDKKGAGVARNLTILNGSVSDILTMFDADSRFNRDDAMEILVKPVISGKYVCTHCKTIIVKDDYFHKETLGESIYKGIANASAHLEKFVPVGRVLGLTLTRSAFFKIDGFALTSLAEDWLLNYRLSVNYGMYSRKFINRVVVLSSDRRAAAMGKDGLKIFNYGNNYR